ncbi:TPA: hypothetical protein ACH3X3_010896 [Trebouxia sp. C0006]
MFLISMVLVGQLVDNVDLPQERKEPVKTALLQLGFSASSATDKAFCSLSKKQLRTGPVYCRCQCHPCRAGINVRVYSASDGPW